MTSFFSGNCHDDKFEKILRETLAQFHSETGTIHRLDEPAQLLHLVAHVGLPPQLLDIVKTIPVGKGIAGETVAKNRPVTICNLQTDTSGVARPGAKQTGVGGAICVPVRSGIAGKSSAPSASAPCANMTTRRRRSTPCRTSPILSPRSFGLN